MLQHLFKPKWQSKKPAVRLKALATLNGESDALIFLAKTDVDSEVRMHAVQKLQHIPTLATIAAKTDGVIPRAAKKRLSELAISQNIDEYALEHAYQFIDDYSVHCYVVSDTKKTLKVRKSALHYINDQNVLFELAKTDSSKEMQFLAAEKINDYSQLKRLEKLTKNNKRLRQLLKEKSYTYQVQKTQLNVLKQLCVVLENLGNNNKWKQDKTHFLTIQQQWKNMPDSIPAALQQRYDSAALNFAKKQTLREDEEAQLQPIRNHYQTIILTLENVLKELSHPKHRFTIQKLKEILAHNLQQWETFPNANLLSKQELLDFQQHYQTIQYGINRSIEQFKQQQFYTQRFDKILFDAQKLLDAQYDIQAKQIEHLQKSWQKIKLTKNIRASSIDTATQQKYKQLMQALKCKLLQQQQHIEQYIVQIEQWLDQMESYIEAEQLSKSIELYQKASQLLNQHTFPPTAYRRIKQRIQTATPIIKSAQSWRQWGTNQIREQLINTAQQLSEAEDIPPLERAKQLKALRHKWKKLGKIDPHHQQKQWKTFDTLCTKAYVPCQQFYKEESNSRSDNLQIRQKICEELQQLEQTTHWHTVDWKQITKTIYQYRKQWKQTGAIDRSHWQVINQQFNDAMDNLEQRLSIERDINWTKRQHLVTQAETLLTELKQSKDLAENLSRFIESAKQLQTQWQPTVTHNRTKEQALWNQFRASIDEIFNQQRNLHDAGQYQLKQNLDNKQLILQQLKTLLNSDLDTNILTAQTQFKRLKTQFNAITSLPKGKGQRIQTDFNKLKTAFIKHLSTQQQQQQLEQIMLLADKTVLCCVENKDVAIQTAWTALDRLQDKKLEEKITQCFLQTTTQDHTKVLDNLFDLVLDIEILLSLPSPVAYQAARMKRQVERLSEQMLKASSSEIDKQQRALTKIIEFYLLLACDIENRQIIEARFSQIEVWIKTSLENAKKC
jgi:hypothetical protein